MESLGDALVETSRTGPLIFASSPVSLEGKAAVGLTQETICGDKPIFNLVGSSGEGTKKGLPLGRSDRRMEGSEAFVVVPQGGPLQCVSVGWETTKRFFEFTIFAICFWTKVMGARSMVEDHPETNQSQVDPRKQEVGVSPNRAT